MLSQGREGDANSVKPIAKGGIESYRVFRARGIDAAHAHEPYVELDHVGAPPAPERARLDRLKKLPLVDQRQFLDVAEHEGRAACELEPAHTGFLHALKGAGRTTEKIQLDLFRRPRPTGDDDGFAALSRPRIVDEFAHIGASAARLADDEHRQ